MKVNDIELESQAPFKVSKPKFNFEEEIFFEKMFPDQHDPPDFDEPILLHFKQKENFNDNHIGYKYLRYRHYTR